MSETLGKTRFCASINPDKTSPQQILVKLRFANGRLTHPLAAFSTTNNQTLSLIPNDQDDWFKVTKVTHKSIIGHMAPNNKDNETLTFESILSIKTTNHFVHIVFFDLTTDDKLLIKGELLTPAQFIKLRRNEKRQPKNSKPPSLILN